MKRAFTFFLMMLLIIGITTSVFAGGQPEEKEVGKKYAGQKIRVIFMSATYADAARDISPEFEEETGAKVEVVDFPYVTLHEKQLLDLTRVPVLMMSCL